MNSLPIRTKQQPCEIVQETIQAHREWAAGTKPAWYYLANSKMPDLCKDAVGLLREEYREEALSENKTTAVEKWSRVERQLRDKMPAQFDTLDRLEKHAEIWTVCDRKTIARLFEGAVTEPERLTILLGSPVELTSLGEPTQQG